jgi:hypothetical protein
MRSPNLGEIRDEFKKESKVRRGKKWEPNSIEDQN